MAGGTIVVSACLLVLGWTSEIVGIFVTDKEMKRSATISIAVLSIYAVDFAINAVQASCRSLIVDTLPIPKQQLGSSWASRMVAIGHLIGYGAGALDLGKVFGPALGDTQFKQLTAIAALTLCVTVGVTCWAVNERVLISDGKDSPGQLGAIETVTQILRTAVNLPKRIAAICFVQFWAWIGWFPFLFYSTTWVGEIYLRYDAPAAAREAEDTLGQVGRIGSMSLIAFSTITFAGSVMLPWLVNPPEDEKPDFTPRPPAIIAPIVIEVEKYRPTLLTAWTISHCIFAGSMILAPFVTSLHGATVLVAICGISWAITCWAPFTFMGVEINKLGSAGSSSHSYNHLTRDSIELDADPGVLRLNHALDDPHASTGEGSGIYLGILNLYTTLPQFVGTFISWIVFSILEPGKSPELAKEAHPDEHHSTDGPNGVAVCLFIGALSAVVAAVATNRLKHIH